MKFGFRSITVRYDMLRYEFACIVGPKKNVGKYVAYQFDEPFWQSPDKQRGMTYLKRGYCPIIWLPAFPKNPADYEVLSHEMAHAVTWMLGERGIPITTDNDETFCYALGHGVRTILEAKRGR